MRKKLLVVSLILAVGVAAIVFWQSPSYSLSGVEPTLRGLAMPYQSVNVSPSVSGIGIRILDRDGRQLKLALPVSASAGKSSYLRLFVGAENSTDAGAVEVAFSADTRRLLIITLEKYRRFSDGTDFVLLQLRGSPQDYARWYGKNIGYVLVSTIRKYL
jgi:hypothetical protein